MLKFQQLGTFHYTNLKLGCSDLGLNLWANRTYSLKEHFNLPDANVSNFLEVLVLTAWCAL